MDNLFQFAVAGMKAQAEVDKVCNQPLAHRDDPITSYEAAEKMVKSGKLSKQERFVYRQIKWYLRYYSQNDFTPKQVANSPVPDSRLYSTIQRRLSALRRKGKIDRLNTEGGIYKENCGQKLMKRQGCAVWRLL